MKIAVRRLCLGTPILRDLYLMVRKTYQNRRVMKAAESYFSNLDEYRKALKVEDGKIVDIRTKDGLILSIRRNYMDAAILAEVFLDKCYVQGLTMPDQPIVVDIGGYIGDFALYAAKCLNARKVVVCEPSPPNWTLLRKNVANNHYEDRIEMVNKAVTDGEDVMMNVDAPDRGQARVTAYYDSGNLSGKTIPGVTLASLVEDHGLRAIDLLKIDCEGGEYTILSTTPAEVFDRIRNVVFEYHEIDGFEAKLTAVKQKLCDAGFSLKARGSLIFASRE